MEDFNIYDYLSYIVIEKVPNWFCISTKCDRHCYYNKTILFLNTGYSNKIAEKPQFSVTYIIR